MVLQKFLFRRRVGRPFLAKKRCNVMKGRSMEAWYANLGTGEDTPLVEAETKRATAGRIESTRGAGLSACAS
jgi:hypothetical protein